MRVKNRFATSRLSFQRGQGMVEFGVAAAFFVVPLLIGITWLARVESSQQHMHQAARYAAWERTVWYRSGNSYVRKSDTDLAREVTKRIYAPVRNVVDTSRDRQAINMTQDQLDPFLYTPDFRQHRTLPMFRPSAPQQSRANLSYAKRGESNNISRAFGVFGSVLGLQTDGVAISTVTSDLEVIPFISSLETLPTKFNISARNALLSGAWNANGTAGERDTVKRTVITDYLTDVPGLSVIQPILGFLFPEFNTLDLGHVDTEKMACQRVSSMRGSNC